MVCPCINLQHLDVIEALIDQIEPRIFGFHIASLIISRQLGEEGVDEEGYHENGHYCQKGQANVVEDYGKAADNDEGIS
jgi:hypothetical protein